MAESFIQKLFSERIGGNQFGKVKTIYKFEKIKIAKREAMKIHPGMEILDFGVGEPDEMAYEIVRNALKKECDNPDNRGYADNGIQEFKEASAKYMKDVFNVDIDPETEVNHCIGEKPALAMFPLTLINPGDVVLMTVPGYPVLGTHTSWLGGEVVNLPLKKENNFLPELDNIDKDILKRAKILVLNYPNNPTGAVADEDFYKKVVDFAKKNEIVVVSDEAYAAIVHNGKKPISFLSVDGAKDVGVAMHSLSKSYNMTGWRIGFVCGNPLLVNAFSTVKDNIDSGQFIAIQKAAVEALKNPWITEEITAKYNRRLKGLVEVLQSKGFDAKVPDGTFYLYVSAPKGLKNGKQFESAEAVSQFLIKEKLISTVPEDVNGRFLRFSATFVSKGESDEKRVMNELDKRLGEIDFEF